MVTQKIEPRLEDELTRIEVAGETGHLLPVIMELHGQDAELLQELEQVGAKDVRRLGLVNAVTASLTVGQIRRIAEHPDVKLVISNRPDKVTTSPSVSI